MQDLQKHSPKWEQRVGGFTHIPALLSRLGADPDRVLREAGLATDALSSPEKRIPFGAVGTLLERCAHHTTLEHFALMAGDLWSLEDLGLVGEISRNCVTLGDALHSLTVHQHLNSSGGLAFMTKCAAIVDVGYAVYYPGIEHPEQIYDYALAATASCIRELAGTAWAPSEVFIPHSRPARAMEYRTRFRVLPRFDSELCALRFPTYWLNTAIAGASSQRRRAALQSADRVGEADLLDRVNRGLRTLLLRGSSSGDDLARMLSMHRRTLNRRLQDRGTTFQRVLDDIRFEAARQFLSYSHLPLDDIAAALGYAGISPFMRTFHRWSGVTPGQWRRDSQQRTDTPRTPAGRAATALPQVRPPAPVLRAMPREEARRAGGLHGASKRAQDLLHA